MDTTDYCWYALYTKPRAEKKALSELQQKGIEAYLPLRRELKQWNDRKKWIETPIINSYIFIRILLSDYRKVFEAKSIVSYVCYKRKAVIIPDREIEAMQRMVENKLSFYVESENLKKGQTVTVNSGSLKGISGEITEIQGERKLFLRISHIGYSLVVSLDDETVMQLTMEN